MQDVVSEKEELKRGKLKRHSRPLDALLDEAAKEGLSYREVLYRLCCAEAEYKAVKRGYSTLFTSAVSLLSNLQKARDEGKLEERLTFYGKPKLLIVDELGYLPLERESGHLFFQLVSRRYERGSLMLTSNRSVGDWGDIFGDTMVATAILDRLLHHSTVVMIRGESYRLMEKRRSGLLRKEETSPASAD